MDNTINNDIIQKTAIYKAIAMLPQPEFKDLWAEKNLIEHQKNYENKNVSETNDTMNETKTNSTPNDWRDITDPKLRKKMRLREKWKRYHNKYKNNSVYVLRRRKCHKDWRESNKDKVKLQKKVYREKWKTDIQYRLSNRLRKRLHNILNNDQKSGSAVKDLGCTIDELKIYLESKFQPGMTWDNWTIDGWHIDHIKPLASFDLSDRKQLLEACHYTNLQPLWAKDNLEKGDRWY